MSTDAWVLSQTVDVAQIPHYETVYTLTNGFMGIRGSVGFAMELGTPGCYLAGVFNKTPVFGEELANIPSFSEYRICVAGVEISGDLVESLSYTLHMRRGILFIDAMVCLPDGKRLRITEERFVHLQHKSLGLMRIRLTPLNFTAPLRVTSMLNLSNAFTVVNGERIFHLKRTSDGLSRSGAWLETETRHSRIRIGQVMRLLPRDVSVAVSRGSGQTEVWNQVEVRGIRNRAVTLDLYSVCVTSQQVTRLKVNAIRQINAAVRLGWTDLRKSHERAWDTAWKIADVQINGDEPAQKLARYNLFQLIGLSPWRSGVSIAAKGLHGEGYRGHVFWDTEMYLLPFYTFTDPTSAGRLLDYRLERLPVARRIARRMGRKGARFPWESAGTGVDVTPKEGDTSKQEHIIADVAYAAMKFIETDNLPKKKRELYPLVVDCAAYYASRVEKQDKGYVINDAIGPDEFHQGIDNNFYTNYLVRKLLKMVVTLPGGSRSDRERYANIADTLFLPLDAKKGFHEQFEGYFSLKEMKMTIDPEGRRILSPYHMSIYNSPEAVPVFGKTKLLKQADAIMLYSLCFDDFDTDMVDRAYAYYEPRTTHGSSLSRAPYSMVAARLGRMKNAYRDFMRSAELDLVDRNNGAGIHTASLGGVWQMLVLGFGGMSVTDGVLQFSPALPAHWKRLSFRIVFQRSTLRVEIDTSKIRITRTGSRSALKVLIHGTEYKLFNTLVVSLTRSVRRCDE